VFVEETLAVTWVEDTNVVGIADPLKLTTAPVSKFVPFTVSVKAEPAATLVGLIEVRVGPAGVLTVKLAEFEVWPSSVTVTGNVPAVAVWVAVTAAVTWVEDTKVVAKAVPLKLTTALLSKPVPLTVKVKLVFCVALVGLSELMVGTTAIDLLPEVPPPGAALVTVTERVPLTVRSDAGTVAVRDVPDTKVVETGVPLTLAVDPFTKLVPVRVMVVAPLPAVIEFGLTELNVGTGLLTVKVAALEVPPPLGFTTVTESVPAVAVSLDGMVAVRDVPDTKVVDRAEPFQSTADPERKPAPFTVSVKLPAPAADEDGLRLPMVSDVLATSVRSSIGGDGNVVIEISLRASMRMATMPVPVSV